MNEARKRRPLIRDRARKGFLWRMNKEDRMKCEHGIRHNGLFCETCHPELKIVVPQTVHAHVVLRDEFSTVGVSSHISVDLPMNGLHQTVLRMYHFGFWARRDKTMMFFPAKSIMRIHIDGEENVL